MIKTRQCLSRQSRPLTKHHKKHALASEPICLHSAMSTDALNTYSTYLNQHGRNGTQSPLRTSGHSPIGYPSPSKPYRQIPSKNNRNKNVNRNFSIIKESGKIHTFEPHKRFSTLKNCKILQKNQATMKTRETLPFPQTHCSSANNATWLFSLKMILPWKL